MAFNKQVANHLGVGDQIRGLRTESEERYVTEGRLPLQEPGRVLSKRTEMPADQIGLL